MKTEVIVIQVDFAHGSGHTASPGGMPLCLCNGCTYRQCPCPFSLHPSIRGSYGGGLVDIAHTELNHLPPNSLLPRRGKD